MGIVYGAVAVLLVVVLFFVAVTAFQEIRPVEAKEPRMGIRKKYNILMAAYKDLHNDYDKLQDENERLKTELVAHRNKLPWISIEELDGPQEQENGC